MTENLKDYPFTVPTRMPYTNSSTEINKERIRIIACIHCKYKMWSTTPAPICSICDHEMISVVKSVNE